MLGPTKPPQVGGGQSASGYFAAAAKAPMQAASSAAAKYSAPAPQAQAPSTWPGLTQPNYSLGQSGVREQSKESQPHGAFNHIANAGAWNAQVPTGTQQPYDQQQGVMNQPGANEQFWQQHSGDLNGPSQSSQYWNGVQGNFNSPTNSQGLYDKGPANVDAYFNDAQKTASTQLDNSLAARGVYDTGAGIDQQRQLDQNMAGQKAQFQANYMSGLAGQADSQNASLWNTGGNLAGQAGNSDLSRLLGGSQMSNTAQNNMMGRERGNLHDMMDYAGMVGGNYQGNADKGIQQNADQVGQIADMGSQIGGFKSKEFADKRNRMMQWLGLGAQAADGIGWDKLFSGSGGGGGGGGQFDPDAAMEPTYF